MAVELVVLVLHPEELEHWVISLLGLQQYLHLRSLLGYQHRRLLYHAELLHGGGRESVRREVQLWAGHVLLTVVLNVLLSWSLGAKHNPAVSFLVVELELTLTGGSLILLLSPALLLHVVLVKGPPPLLLTELLLVSLEVVTDLANNPRSGLVLCQVVKVATTIKSSNKEIKIKYMKL